MRPITFAHRGARLEEPENTIPAFRRALERGATGLESDAHLSVDGEVVLVHDPVVRRWHRRWRVVRTTAAELAQLGIPRLADLYDELGDAYDLSLDVKSVAAGGPILELARHQGRATTQRLWLCSPSRRELAALRDASDDVRLVHSTKRRSLREPIERYAADLATTGIDVVNLHRDDWTAGLVGLFHRFGRRAFAWDVQEVRHLRAALTMGVDAVYCDHVDRMVATVAEWTDDAAHERGPD